LDVYDLIIALDQSAAGVLQEIGIPETRFVLWKIDDPWGGDLTEYDRSAIDIKRRLVRLRASGRGIGDG